MGIFKSTMKDKFLVALLVIVIVAAVFLLTKNIPIAGSAFISPEKVGLVVKDMASSKALGLLGENSSICLVVETDKSATYYFSIAKGENSPIIKNEYCADPGQDNVIIKMNSFDSLLEARHNPKWFAINRRNTGYYMFPSNYVMKGGEINCTAKFQMNYCEALQEILEPEEMSGLQLQCCAEYKPEKPVVIAAG